MYAITRERPLKGEKSFLKLCKDIGIDPASDSAYSVIVALYEDIKKDKSSDGLTLNISGSWGIGKTSYANILVDKLKPGNLVINARSMFYGNFDEYINSFFGHLYKSLHKNFGIKLKDLKQLSKNVTVSLGAGLNFGFFSLSANHSRQIQFDKSVSSDELLSKQSPLNNKLSALSPRKVIVILDDVDRLSPTELITLLRLIEVLKQLKNVIVIAVGDIRTMGDILESGGVPNPYSYARKVFDHRIHLTRNLRDVENILHLMVQDIIQEKLNDAQKLAISEAYYFLVLRQIIQNIRDLATVRIDSSSEELTRSTTGLFWTLLNSAGDSKLGPVYDGIRGFFSTSWRTPNQSGTHKIWAVTNNEIVPLDNTRDGMALLTLRPSSYLRPWETNAIFRGIMPASYWSALIVPSPDETTKVEKYQFTDDISNIGQLFASLDRDEHQPREILGTQEPESRWSIVKKFMTDRNRNEMTNDHSLTQLNDLRLLKGFASAVAERLPQILSNNSPSNEHKRLELFVECTDTFEALIKIEKGDL